MFNLSEICAEYRIKVINTYLRSGEEKWYILVNSTNGEQFFSYNGSERASFCTKEEAESQMAKLII